MAWSIEKVEREDRKDGIYVVWTVRDGERVHSDACGPVSEKQAEILLEQFPLNLADHLNGEKRSVDGPKLRDEKLLIAEARRGN